MIPEVVKTDIGYQQKLLEQLREEISYQSKSVSRLLDDIILRREPQVALKLPIRYKFNSAEKDGISVLYDGIKLKGNVEFGNYEAPIVSIGNRGTIHMYGAGRSGLEARSWAMRLVHLNFDVSEPGSTLAKPVKPSDIGIFCSGGWETLSTITYAKKTKEIGATTVPITSHPELLKVGEDCDYFIEIGGREKLGKIRDYYVESLKGKSSTHMDTLGTVFEFKLSAFKDLFIHQLCERLGIEEERMKERHVTFE
jgi:D-arabinose 5-phosphate isomerase GutQ